MRRPIITVDSFFGNARQLREHFDSRFADPHSADSGRFVWDYWHVPGQYTVLRTPAYHFFPPALYRALHEKLVLWGRSHLGCHDISPPWLSCYVDGCRQDFHADLPHGPWAFVFSLTPWKTRRFTGGETFLLREEILDYWSRLGSFTGTGLEENGILRTIEPLFNRLSVFDPRIPHGVRRVEGASDPRDGRLVIHGWFVQPRPFISGPLRQTQLQSAIDGLVGRLDSELTQGAPLNGILSVRFTVTPSGACSRIRALSNTIVSPGDEKAADRMERLVRSYLKGRRFPRHTKASEATLPLVFGE